MNIADFIAERVAATPDHLALIHHTESWTYRALWSRAEAIATRVRELLAAEFTKTAAPRVGLFCPNGADYVVLALGILRAGACFIPIAPELVPSERTAQIVTTAQHLVIAAGTRPWLPGPAIAESAGELSWQWTRLTPEAAFPEDRFAALEPAFVRFSSGTTGDSKGVVLSHTSLLARIRSANRRLRLTAADRVLWTLPMAHHFAVSIILYLLEGATTVLVDSHLSADVLAVARSSGATVMYGSPFHYQLLAADESGLDWPTLRLAVSTAAALNAETAQKFERRFGLPLTQALGIIEAGLPLVNTEAAHEAPTSIGRPDDFETALRDEAGTEAATGELWLRGPGMFDAYLLPWRECRDLTPDGWFATGDIARRDEAGRLFLCGRRKAMINVGGLKFFPEEIEAILNRHPGVKESRVLGEPHERWETIPVAEIVPHDPAQPPTGTALGKFCREQLAAYKVPQRFRVVDSLPRTASGKLKR